MQNQIRIHCPKCNAHQLTVHDTTVKCDACGNIFLPEQGKVSIDRREEINDLSGEKKEIVNSTFDKKVLEMCRQGHLLQAVKYVKDTKGWGLKESKDYVDSLCEANGMARGSGCAGKAAVLVFVLGVMVVYLMF